MQWIWCLTLLPIMACASGAKRGTDLEIHGHRGARALEPENSLYAFAHALENGATVLEADLGVSRDGHVVLNHDAQVDTELCVSRDAKLRRLERPLVNSLTLAQLKTYDCGSAYDADFPKRTLRPGAQVVSFSEFLAWLNGVNLANAKTVRLNLETKIEANHPTWTVGPQEFVELIAKELKKHRIDASRVILQSFDFRTIIYSKKRYPQFQTAALYEGSGLDVATIFASTRADYLSPDAILLTHAKVKEAQELGMRVVPWTLNKRSQWGYFIDMGVDGIITDDPAGLVQYLQPARKAGYKQ